MWLKVLYHIFVFLGYYLSGYLGLTYACFGKDISLIWIPSGIALFVFLRYHQQFLISIFLGAFLVNWWVAHSPLWVALGIAFGNTFSYYLSSVLLKKQGFQGEFNKSQDFVLFLLLGALVGAFLAAINGIGILIMVGKIPITSFFNSAWIWLAGDFSGVLLITPLLLTFRKEIYKEYLKPQLLLMFLLLIISSLISFNILSLSNNASLPITFVPFPFLIWISLRYETHITTLAILVLVIIAFFDVILYVEPSEITDWYANLVLFWLYITSVAFIGILVTAIQAEKNYMYQQLQESLKVQESLNEELSANEEELRQGMEIQKKHLEQLHINDKRSRALLDGIPDTILRLDREGHYLDYKIEFEQIFRIFKQVVISTHIGELPLNPDVIQNFKQKINKTLDTGFSEFIEIDLEGHTYEIRICKSGEEEVITILRDITTRKKVEDDLRKTLQELKSRNFELDNFVYKVSHDLRAPLASVLGLLDMINIEPENTHEYLLYIGDRVHKLDHFIQTVLTYSRTLNQVLSIDKIDFEKIIQQTFDELKYIDLAQNIDLQIKIHHHADYFNDPFRLGIILKNFISNAIKYQDTEKKPNFLHFDITTNENEAIIIIQDNGIGIKEEHLPKIFDMFYRGTAKSDGSGLGLYIVRLNIEKLQGTLHIDSTEKIGTTFKIILPQIQA